MNFELSITDKDNEIIIFCLNYDSILNYTNDLENRVSSIIKDGKLYIDQLLVTGDGKNRYIFCEFRNGQIILSSARVINPNHEYKELAKSFWNKHISFINNSILTISEKNRVLGI